MSGRRRREGIALDPAYSGRRGRSSEDFVGVVSTYAGVASAPMAHRLRCERRRALVVLDELHHAGDAKSWGDAVREAFEPAVRRLALTGTPFRSDTAPIPFVTYAPGIDGVPRSVADHSFGYADALREGVVRPVLFMAYWSDLRWRTRMGAEVTARLGKPLTPRPRRAGAADRAEAAAAQRRSIRYAPVHQAGCQTGSPVGHPDGPPRPAGTHQRLNSLRRELNGLVAAWHHRTGQPRGTDRA